MTAVLFHPFLNLFLASVTLDAVQGIIHIRKEHCKDLRHDITLPPAPKHHSEILRPISL